MKAEGLWDGGEQMVGWWWACGGLQWISGLEVLLVGWWWPGGRLVCGLEAANGGLVAGELVAGLVLTGGKLMCLQFKFIPTVATALACFRISDN